MDHFFLILFLCPLAFPPASLSPYLSLRVPPLPFALFVSRIMVSCYEVPTMCTWINFAIWQSRVRQLHMQSGVYRAGWNAMRSLPARNLQVRQRIDLLRQVLARQVLDGDGADVGGDVQRVPDAYLLWGGEQQDWQLHMQQGLYGGGRGGVYGMRGGHLQGGEWISGLLAMRWGQVLDVNGGYLGCDVRCMSCGVILRGWERRGYGLHVQYGVHRA